MRYISFISTFILFKFFSFVSSQDLCANPDNKLFGDAIKQSVSPHAGSRAGTYHKMPDVKTILDCAMACCDVDNCNVAFFHKNTCYILGCHRSSPEGCEPVHRTSHSFKDTLMITLRDVNPKGVSGGPHSTSRSKTTEAQTEPTSKPSGELRKTSKKPKLDFSLDTTSCTPDNTLACNTVLEECKQVSEDRYMCHCRTGLHRDPDSLECVDSDKDPRKTLLKKKKKASARNKKEVEKESGGGEEEERTSSSRNRNSKKKMSDVGSDSRPSKSDGKDNSEEKEGKVDKKKSKKKKKMWKPASCRFGELCGLNEVCIIPSDSKKGTCRCRDGFQRDKEEKCEKMKVKNDHKTGRMALGFFILSLLRDKVAGCVINRATLLIPRGSVERDLNDLMK